MIIELMRVLVALLFGITAWAQGTGVGSRVCADCHAEIFRTYMRTGMAQSSGRAGAGSFVEKFPAGPVADKSSGATYRISRGDDSYRMRFDRPQVGVSGVRDLKWFSGSGS